MSIFTTYSLYFQCSDSFCSLELPINPQTKWFVEVCLPELLLKGAQVSYKLLMVLKSLFQANMNS